MKTVSLSGSLRENVGKKDARKHREQGQVPCVLYGGEEQIHFVTDERLFGKILFTPETFLIKLNIDGKEYEALVQDVQYHPVSDSILHADFLQVFPGKPVKAILPTKYVGTAPGIIAGGKVVAKYRKLKVKGLVDDMPDFLPVDISHLDIGQSVKVRDLSYDKLELLDTPSEMVVAVLTTRAAAVGMEEPEEEEAEVEEVEGEEGAAEGVAPEGEEEKPE
ncbi:MAG: 50S ribosomal protein L25/general stress protein Ctc [Bacteroidales bacterium]